MLIQHVRDVNGRPFATIVATSANHIGVAICSPKDHFVKTRGIIIAAARAKDAKRVKIPNRHEQYRQMGTKPIVWPIDSILHEEIQRMVLRATKYFKAPPIDTVA